MARDLSIRCREILEWRNTGLYRGTALQELADEIVERGLTDSSDAIRRAEEETIKEALIACAGE